MTEEEEEEDAVQVQVPTQRRETKHPKTNKQAKQKIHKREVLISAHTTSQP